MGYYIATSGPKEKAKWICGNLSGEIIGRPASFSDIPVGKGLVVVVDNGTHESAAYIYSPAEFTRFTRPNDPRSHEYLLLPEDLAQRESGYKK